VKPHLIASREQLLRVVRDRRDELDLSHETIDAIAGLQSGYTSKLLSDPPMRGFGEMSLKALLEALGLRIAVAVIVEDVDLADRVRARWKPRKRRSTAKPKVPSSGLQASPAWCVASNRQIMRDDGNRHPKEANDVEHENDRLTDQT
jgi:hypothetical protein